MDAQFQNAKSIVQDFVQRSHSSKWEDMIGKESVRGGCVIDALELKCRSKQRRAISEDAANRIRARHPHLWDSEPTWNAKKWSDDEISEIVSIIIRTAADIGIGRMAEKEGLTHDSHD